MCVRTLNKHSRYVTSVCVSSCKRLIVSGSEDKTAVVFRPEDNHTLHTLAHSGPVLSAVFSPNDIEIFSGSDNGKIKIWNTETGQLLKTLNAHSGSVTCIVVSGKFIASSSTDKTVKTWDTNYYRNLHTFHDQSADEVCAVDIRDNVLATLGWANKLVIRDIRTGSIIQTLQTNGQSYYGYYKIGLKIPEGGKFIVSGADDGKVNRWRGIN